MLVQNVLGQLDLVVVYTLSTEVLATVLALQLFRVDIFLLKCSICGLFTTQCSPPPLSSRRLDSRHEP